MKDKKVARNTVKPTARVRMVLMANWSSFVYAMVRFVWKVEKRLWEMSRRVRCTQDAFCQTETRLICYKRTLP